MTKPSDNSQQAAPLWIINTLLLLVVFAQSIYPAPNPSRDKYFIDQIASHLEISVESVEEMQILLLLLGVPLSIKWIWNRFFTQLPYINPIGYWHGFMCLLILELLAKYF